ncbi:MAG: hypothetical protein ACI4XM_07320 [Candidatus Coprovivens sp.]
MSNTTYISDIIVKQMNMWSSKNYQDIVNILARQCTCSTKYISCIEFNPIVNPNYDAGYVFLGPNNILLGEIRWKSNGKCSDFLVYEDNIMEVRNMLAKKRAERARAKSVNRSLEEARKREQPFKKGMKELLNAVKKNFKEVVAVGAFIVVLAASMSSMHSILNPEYINDSFSAGYKAVSSETHRTNDNSGYWYDYGDIARLYDEDTMDFDSFVYGTYKNVGWNQESRIDCMESLFRQFNIRGITDFASFLDYCNSKGACKEKDGKLVIDSGKFCSIMEEYMESLNNVNEFREDKSIGGI